MDHADFRIGREFWFSERLRRCTDVGQRVIVAIRIDEVTAVRMELATMIQTKHTMTGAEAERDGWYSKISHTAEIEAKRLRSQVNQPPDFGLGDQHHVGYISFARLQMRDMRQSLAF